MRQRSSHVRSLSISFADVDQPAVERERVVLAQQRAAIEQLLLPGLGQPMVAAQLLEPCELGSGLRVGREPHLGVAGLALLLVEAFLQLLELVDRGLLDAVLEQRLDVGVLPLGASLDDVAGLDLAGLERRDVVAGANRSSPRPTSAGSDC